MVSGIQIIGVVFGLIASYFTFLHYKREEFTVREFMGWEALWIVFVVVTLSPNSYQVFIADLGVVRVFDLLSVLGFIVVLSISFYTYITVDRLRKNFEKAIRDVALQDEDEVGSRKTIK